MVSPGSARLLQSYKTRGNTGKFGGVSCQVSVVRCQWSVVSGQWSVVRCICNGQLTTDHGHSCDRSHSSVPMSGRFPPDARQRIVTVRAGSVGIDAVFLHEKTPAADDRRVAVMTARV